jgi:hypothetical protein
MRNKNTQKIIPRKITSVIRCARASPPCRNPPDQPGRGGDCSKKIALKQNIKTLKISFL